MNKIYYRTICDQRAYSNDKLRECDFGLIVPRAFVRGIRNIGYRTNLEALSELVDNSIQAYAERVDLVLGYTGERSTRKPDYLAVIDDGHGMVPEMMRFALMWGGTHRENDRDGLGRFGYGLPCATVSMGRRFTVYSKIKRGRLHAVTLDLDRLDQGSLDADHKIAIPASEPTALPPLLRNAIRRNYPDGWKSGTIILLEKLDRLEWATATGLRRNLVRHFGVAYHKLLRTTSVRVDDERVQPIDPLFLEPKAELHGIDEDRAFALDPVTLKIDGDVGGGRGGEVTLRYAWLPPSFAAKDKSRDAIGINANDRFPIIKQYHGIVFSRNGRVVDVQSRTPWTIFLNNDRYIRIEIEFSASLDEAFGITTSKQQVTVSPEMWDRLRAVGLHKAIEHLRSKVKTAKADRPELPLVPRTRTHAGAWRENFPSTVPVVFDNGETAEALRVLLDEIERRSANASANIRREYRALLDGWTTRLGCEPNSSPNQSV